MPSRGRGYPHSDLTKPSLDLIIRVIAYFNYKRLAMLRVFGIILSSVALVVMCTGHAGAQSLDLGADLSKKAMQGIISVTSTIVADTFTPMTHYREGEWTVSLVPAWIDVKQAYDDPVLRGDRLRVLGGGLGGGYALSDRWMLFGIGAYADMDGGIHAKGLGVYRIDVDYGLGAFIAGAGFDLIEGGGAFSIPVYAGACVQGYRAGIDPPALPLSLPGIQQVLDARLSGTGALYSLIGSVALSCDLFDMIRITPYYVFIRSLNRPELRAVTDYTLLSPMAVAFPVKSTLRFDYVTASMLGLKIGLLPSGSVSVSVSIGGLVMTAVKGYSEAHNGIRMISAVLAGTYMGLPGEGRSGSAK